jgi:hypothetical protein
MDVDEDTVDMERRALIMELAQQQQMALQHLDEVVENQRNVRANYYARSDDQQYVPAQRGQQPRDEGGDTSLLEDVREHRQESAQQTQPLPSQDHHTHQHLRHRVQAIDRQHGAYSYSCSFTSIYLTLSAFIAILALVTTPSNVLFSSIWMRVNPSSSTKTTNVGDMHQQLQHTADAFKAHANKLEDGNFVVDGRGNLDDMGLKKSDVWELVVSQSTAKRSSSTEPSKQTSESKYTPPSSTSWTGSLLNFWGEGKDRFIGRPQNAGDGSPLAGSMEQYILLELKFRTALAHFLLSETSVKSALTATDTDRHSSSRKWNFPWEWIKQKPANDNHVEGIRIDDSFEQSVPQGKAQTSNRRRTSNGSYATIHSLLSPIAMNPSSVETLLPTKEGDDTADMPTIASQSTSPPFITFVDKTFSSTPRLIAIANFLIVLTYLLQIAVADLFLGHINTSNTVGNTLNVETGRTPGQLIPNEASRRRRVGRERFVGFLLFKLLLISVVLELDRVDLFMFLTWYTLVSFLRSLSHLAGNTANHASQSGEPPCPGVLRLLALVLVCNVSAAMGCAAIFTDWNILLLLTFDCILLGIDVVTHIMRHVVSTAEEMHRMKVSLLEERQLELHAQSRVQLGGSNVSTRSSRGMEIESDENATELQRGGQESRARADDNLSFDNELRLIDGAIQISESEHGRRMASIWTAVFSLEITASCLTISHFLHVWSLHGTAGLSLVDGVLALHLHSTISLIGKKIAERRNMHRVTREINNSFPDASDLDIRKASAAGDVCCICLNSLLVGGVKKIACGHLFHTNCLREVLERERSFASAKCPLCRASVVTGRHDMHVVHHVGAVGAGVGNRRAQPAQLINQQLNTGEQSLLRFSTENLLPSWLPIPAFAFEVVRREATVVVEPTPNPEAGWQRFFRRGGQVQGEDVNDDGNNHLQPQGQQETSFWRRVLILVGAIPMSPEEEAVALEQLVDMFPQVR